MFSFAFSFQGVFSSGCTVFCAFEAKCLRNSSSGLGSAFRHRLMTDWTLIKTGRHASQEWCGTACAAHNLRIFFCAMQINSHTNACVVSCTLNERGVIPSVWLCRVLVQAAALHFSIFRQCKTSVQFYPALMDDEWRADSAWWEH